VGNLAGQLSPSALGKIKDLTGQVTWGMYRLAASMAISCGLVLLLTRAPHGQTRTNTD